MFVQRKSVTRFNLLLLDEGEFYVKDFVASCTWPADVQGNWQQLPRLTGQIRLCTKSLFFEPDDVRVPIVRLPFTHLQQLEGVGDRRLVVEALRWTLMKANAADTPYIFEKGRVSTWTFDLTYAQLTACMPVAQHMLVASRMPPADQEELLQTFMQQLEDELRFDPGHLRNPASEVILLELPVLHCTPLVKDPGRIVVTSSHLYLQPLHNVSGDTAVRSHPIAAVAAAAKRRSSLRDIGLEIFFVDPQESSSSGRNINTTAAVWGADSAFFVFRTQADRDEAVNVLNSHPEMGAALPGGRDASVACKSILEAAGGWLARVTSAWQHGHLSNFDYLLYCNLAAGRSFNDITQYPVFPWVLQDYSSPVLDLQDVGIFRDLSRPIGALNPVRLARFRTRYNEMASDPDGDPPFLYGTHYSCLGYTLFWLVRAAPGHMLRLQNGRFDAPDRLFCSIEDAWKSVLSNPADVKELIPEFYMPNRVDFLLNKQHLALGVRQTGKPVGDVQLPPWSSRAKATQDEETSAAETFLNIHRAALEAPYVSANLHHWIDLIFGVESRGRAAEQADNVFRHTAYEGSINVENVSDPVERAALEVAINEFGQCPRQLFVNPHPRRLVCSNSQESFSTSGSSPISGGSSTNVQHQISESSPSKGRHSSSLALVSTILAATQDEGLTTAAVEPSPILLALDVAEQQQLESSRHNEEIDSQKQQEKLPEIVSSPFSHVAGVDDEINPAAATTTATTAANNNNKSNSSLIHQQLDGRSSSAKNDQGSSAGALGLVGSASSGGLMASLTGSLSRKWQGLTANRSGSAKSIASGVTAAGGGDGDDENLQQIKDTAQTVEQQPVSPVAWKFAGGGSKTNQSIGGVIREHTVTSWGPGLGDRLKPGRAIAASSESLNAVLVNCCNDKNTSSSGSPPLAYTVGQDGFIRVFQLNTGVQIRASKLSEQPLTSIAHLQLSPSSSTGTMASTLLASCYDGNVHLYLPNSGTISGAFTAHDDVVACLSLPQQKVNNSSTLTSASWDGSVKLWSLAEGREPWATTLPQPISTISGLPGGVWALAVDEESSESLSSSNLHLAGTEDGFVTLLDLRSPASVVWEQSLCDDYVGAVAFVPGTTSALAASADGALSLLDLRCDGVVHSSVNCGAPLRCCATDGSLALAGGEGSRGLALWDIRQQLGLGPVVSTCARTATTDKSNTSWTPPGIDGLYPFIPLSAGEEPVVNGIACGWEGDGDVLHVVAALENGQLAVFTAAGENHA